MSLAVLQEEFRDAVLLKGAEGGAGVEIFDWRGGGSCFWGQRDLVVRAGADEFEDRRRRGGSAGLQEFGEEVEAEEDGGEEVCLQN